MKFTVYGKPVAKPRMTRRDKWAKRPCVLKYWAYKTMVKEAYDNTPVEERPKECGCLYCIFFVPMSPSWSKKKKILMREKPHRQKPDVDNLTKGIMDALFEDDSGIWNLGAYKYWDDGKGPRVEITIS